ncbi:DMT family transporter [Paracoccus jiaweipingae]|uniref:DMT family transporter n=1 Tax=unclassified Paracoccus (in: a-proteobacteria) TaxID=2688777 RepID=UPI00378747A1
MRALPRAFALMKQRISGGQDQQGLGILMLLAAVFAFTLMDATGKYLTQNYAPLQVVWARYAGNFVIVLVLLAPRLPRVARSRHPGLQLGRGLTQIASIGLFFTALQFIGLAEATAIMDINPVLITLGAALFLGERIGIRRILGIAAAMAGAMIIIRPGAGVFQPAALLPLMAACTYAAGAVMTRMVRGDSTATSVLWSVSFGTLATSVVVPFVWQPIAAHDLWAFVLIGALGTIAQALLIKAFSMAEAAAVAPFGYTGLLWAGLWGWLFWGTVPDLWTIIGAVIIVIAGLYVWSREAAAMRAARRTEQARRTDTRTGS